MLFALHVIALVRLAAAQVSTTITSFSAPQSEITPAPSTDSIPSHIFIQSGFLYYEYIEDGMKTEAASYLISALYAPDARNKNYFRFLPPAENEDPVGYYSLAGENIAYLSTDATSFYSSVIGEWATLQGISIDQKNAHGFTTSSAIHTPTSTAAATTAAYHNAVVGLAGGVFVGLAGLNLVN